MAGWAGRRGARTGRTQGVDTRPAVALAVLAALLAAYVYKYWEPQSPLIGTARVVDGDTIDIAGTRIRLEDIDAPEANQTCVDARGQSWPCGKTATNELRAHINGNELNCQPSGFDRYRRVLAVCSLPDGSDVNAWMVRQGWALTSGYFRTYGVEEADAELARRGIWAGHFTPPAQWRRQQAH
jgi:endonuclease YncB( thermonuclease family)